MCEAAFSPANVPPSPLLLGTVDLTPAPGTSLTDCEPPLRRARDVCRTIMVDAPPVLWFWACCWSRLSWRLRSWCSRSVAGTNRAPTVTPTLPDGDVMSLPVVVVLLLRPPVVAEHMGSIPSIPAITSNRPSPLAALCWAETVSAENLDEITQKGELY